MADKERYAKEKAEYESANSSAVPKEAPSTSSITSAPTKKKVSDSESSEDEKPVKRDPNAPKRGKSAYMLFYENQIKQSSGGSRIEAMKGIAETWKSLSEEEKKVLTLLCAFLIVLALF